MEKEKIFSEISEVYILMCKALLNRYRELNLNVTPLQSRIIMYLYENKEIVIQKELKNFIGCNKSTLSSVLSTMEKNGFIERKDSLDDNRKNSIHLTSSALEIVNILKKDHEDIENTLRDGISDEELKSFKEFLEKIEKNIERI